ncbi:MAG: isoprenylcysteine carboxylmethyltransferase family protein [Nitrospinota bacterium]|nr:isoprenylcysteine carboxylmethyltransferase family protein [Nitrospinota bacterium]
MTSQYALLAAAWALFCLFHSLLAATAVESALRRVMGRLAPWYRLMYNIFAIVTVLPPVLMEKRWAGETLLRLGSWDMARQAIFYSVVAAFIWAIFHYRGTNISGLSPSHGPSAPPVDGEFRTGGPLRYVRHPLYSLAFILLWSRPLTDAALVTNLILSIYILLGARLEEERLTSRFGDEYVKYKSGVSAFLPLRWPGAREETRRSG